MEYKVQQISVDTNQEAENMLKSYEVRAYTPTAEEVDKVWFVKKRFTAMDDKRAVIAKSWPIYQQQYEAIFVPYSDGRSASNVPLERSIIELYVAEAIKRPTKFTPKAVCGYEKQAMVFSKTWNYDWNVNNRNNQIVDNEYITAIFGTSIMYTGFEMSHRIINDFVGVENDGKIRFSKKLQSQANIILRNFDIREFWIDERAHNIEEAVDCIVEEFISEEQYYNLRFDPFYKNIDTEKASYVYDNEKKTFLTKEDRANQNSKYVKLRHYWNAQLDKYMVIVNDRVIVREHPILNASHSLPFVVRQYGKNPFSVYGYGLCECLTPFKSELNDLRELLMDAIKRSGQEIIAIGNGLTFDSSGTFGYNNTMMKFKGNLAWNFQQLSGTPPNQAIFSQIDRIFKDVAIFCGIDIQNILGDPQQTAYQTAVQKESSLKRINVVFTNRDYAFERLGNLHKDNIQMFYPMKLVRQLVELDDDDKPKEEVKPTYPKIQIEWEEYKGGRFVKTSKSSMFEVTPERIRWDIKLDVYTDLNAPTINEVEKAQKMEFFTTLQNINNAYMTNPMLESIMPMKDTIKDLAESLNIETEDSDEEEVKKEQDKLVSELQWMLWGNPPMWEMTPMPTEAPETQPEAQPNVPTLQS